MAVQVRVSEMSRDEKIWYAKLMIDAILEDRKVEFSEIDYLVKVLYFLREDERNEMKALLKKQERIPNVLQDIPDTFTTEQKGSIFTELVLLMISDCDTFSTSERNYLEELAQGLGLSDDFRDQIFKWSEDALNVNLERLKLINAYTEAERRSRMVNRTK